MMSINHPTFFVLETNLLLRAKKRCDFWFIYNILVYNSKKLSICGGVIMRDLYKYFYEDDDLYESIYDKRMASDSLVTLDLTIKPINQPHTYQLYYVPTNKMMTDLAQIYKWAKALNEISFTLPEIAKHQFLNQLIVEEIQQTNELEGVKSSRTEIVESIKRKHQQKKELRFQSLVEHYRLLIEEEDAVIKSPEQLRELYDRLLQSEISEENKLDGKLFRQDQVSVYKSAYKEIHRGLLPESAIYDALKQMLDFLNEDEDVPVLIKIAIVHYYFGYIHPFYDGNGRLSRVLTSIYLREELGIFGGLAISQGSYQHEKQYLKAFDITNHFLNRGELNHFIQMFLMMMKDTLKGMYDELKEKNHLLSNLWEKIQALKEINPRDKEAIFMLAQNYFFAVEKGLGTQEVANHLGVSGQTVRSMMNHLEEKGFIKQMGKSPITYFIQNDFIESSTNM